MFRQDALARASSPPTRTLSQQSTPGRSDRTHPAVSQGKQHHAHQNKATTLTRVTHRQKGFSPLHHRRSSSSSGGCTGWPAQAAAFPRDASQHAPHRHPGSPLGRTTAQRSGCQNSRLAGSSHDAQPDPLQAPRKANSSPKA